MRQLADWLFYLNLYLKALLRIGFIEVDNLIKQLN